MFERRASLPLAVPGFGRLAARPPLALPGQRIGLLGGSFNPPHEAHLLISETALRRLGLDRVWWLVTPGNPLKEHAGLAPLDHRLALARRLVANRPITVTGLERALVSPYTVSTLQYLRRRLPAVRFVWLMGADCLAEFDRWRQWRDILGLMPVAVIDRPGWRHRALAGRAALTFARHRRPERSAPRFALETPPAWTFLTARLSDQSSTAIRARDHAPAARA